MRGKRTYGGRPGQRVEEQGTWAAQKHTEAGYGRPVDRGVWTAKTVKRPRQQPAHPPIRQLLGAADAQTAPPATFSTDPTHQLLGSANAETTPAGAPAAAAHRKQRPDATCEGKNGRLSRAPYRSNNPTECHHRGDRPPLYPSLMSVPEVGGWSVFWGGAFRTALACSTDRHSHATPSVSQAQPGLVF